MFRKLKPNEIECRVAQVRENWCQLLLYKDSRADMKILDETVGSMFWKREHTRDNANCIVSIYNKEINQWITKEDTGKESYTEKEKGLASDSFKRACVNWGIGRELYTSPVIYIKLNKDEVIKKGDKFNLSSKINFYVHSINYNTEGEISFLQIKNKNEIKFEFNK